MRQLRDDEIIRNGDLVRSSRDAPFYPVYDSIGHTLAEWRDSIVINPFAEWWRLEEQKPAKSNHAKPLPLP